MSYEIVPSVRLVETGLVHLPSISIGFLYNDRTAKSGIHGILNVKNISPFDLNERFRNIEDLVWIIKLPNPDDIKNAPVELNIEKSANITYISILSDIKVMTFDLEALSRDYYAFKSSDVKYHTLFIAFDLGDKVYFVYKIYHKISSTNSSVHSGIFHHRCYHNFDAKAQRLRIIRHYLLSELVTVNLLKYLYSSNFFDYTYSLSSSSCESCMIKHHLQIYGMIPDSITVPASYSYSRMLANEEIGRKCHRLYSRYPLCEAKSYTNKNYPRSINSDVIDIHIHLPPHKTSCIFPKTLLLDLFILIADILAYG